MADFDKIEQEARKEAEDHPQQLDRAVTEGEQEVDQRVGQDHAPEVQQAAGEIEKELGDQPSGQPGSTA
ncbi:MAG: hypothetical protein KGQ66_03595 [Acidobacteriota bacterium]|nr:hypothetical protein [Acidobacteriota bacterium]